ncbi:MAG: SH3 domain-containing protein [Paracoccus sp. (in: a-proteobacteria)]|nr:SH3 domain-containing protein [Paracoccus sp. (in: a-proteobacteria)]
MIARLILAGLLLAAAPAGAGPDITDIGEVRLTGDIRAGGARNPLEGRAMVCALATPASFLSLRSAPEIAAPEIVKLNQLTIVSMTGETQGDWVRIDEVVFEMAPDGHSLPKASQGSLSISGWVAIPHLCNYFY